MPTECNSVFHIQNDNLQYFKVPLVVGLSVIYAFTQKWEKWDFNGMLNYIVNLSMGSQLIQSMSWFSSMTEYVCVSPQIYGISLHINLNSMTFLEI
jgi:hypothetical protein